MTLSDVKNLAKDTFLAWDRDNASQLAAALAFYTTLSIAPLLLVVLAVAGAVFGADAARGSLRDELRAMFGPQAAVVISAILASSQQRTGIATTIGVITLLFGASIVFGELQTALNHIWGVESLPGRQVRGFVRRRLLSFAMVLAVGFLLFVMLVVSALISSAAQFVSELIPIPRILLQSINVVISFFIIWLLFALIFHYLPDVRLKWRVTWVGTSVTALLFTLGKQGIGFYLGHTSRGSAYGAAGSFIVFLLWVYYSAQIFFLGAEFTEAYARWIGSEIEPDPHATRVRRVTDHG